MKQFIIFLLIICSFTTLSAGTIKGVVKDAESGEPLVGANIILGRSTIGTITDDDGLFIMQNVPEGRWEIIISYLGYIDVKQNILVSKKDVELEIKMKPTVFTGKEVIVEVNRAEERKTPVTFTEVGESQIQRRYATQDVPDLLRTIPGVFTSSAGLGESSIFIRGFDAERIQILINGVPVNDPESQVVYWSNWTGLSGNTASIQVQRGVGASLLGSGAFGGSVNIVTSKFSPLPKLSVRTSIAGYYTMGGYDDTRRVADGRGGSQTYNPFNQVWSIDYTTGLLQNGKINLYLKYERKSGDSYITGTYYNGHSFYLGLQSILGNHILTFNAHGAPQRHFQARTIQDLSLLDKLGREYNRYNHPYQENYYFKPQFELHWDWAISEKAYLKTNAFVTFGRGGGRFLRNDYFDVNTGEVGFKSVSERTDWVEFGRHARFIYENLGIVLYGYDPTTRNYQYGSISAPVTSSGRMLTSSLYDHSWRNDSQNDHNQFGLNAAYQRILNDYLAFTVGGEARYWKARHNAESYYFRKYDIETGGVETLKEVQMRYDYDGIVTNLSGFARLLISPIQNLTVMLDGQYAIYDSKVEERPIRVFDFGLGSWTPYTYLSTKDKKDANGQPLYSDDDYQRTFKFFMPKVGANYNLTPEINFFANYSISKKEPKVGDWYNRDNGPGYNQPKDDAGNPIELKAETLDNIELGAGWIKKYYSLKGNFYIMYFKDKIESVTDQNDNRVTINAGKAKFTGFELEATTRYQKFDIMLSGSYASNKWQKMNIKQIFSIDAEKIVDKVVPFAPERMLHGESGYNWGPFRFGLGFTYWDRYFGNYENTASLPAYFSLDAVISYGFKIRGADVDMRLDLNNLSSRKNFMEAAWTSDFGRNDALNGKYLMYVVQGPLFHTFFTTQVTL